VALRGVRAAPVLLAARNRAARHRKPYVFVNVAKALTSITLDEGFACRFLKVFASKKSPPETLKDFRLAAVPP
jgi:hypothetical protein